MGKKTRGRKRPILVNTLGNLLLVMVHTAGWSDLEGGTWLLLGALRHFCAVLKIWADKSYRGDLHDEVRDLFGVDEHLEDSRPAHVTWSAGHDSAGRFDRGAAIKLISEEMRESVAKVA